MYGNQPRPYTINSGPSCCRQEGIARRLAEDFAKDCNELLDGFGTSTSHVPAIAGRNCVPACIWMNV